MARKVFISVLGTGFYKECNYYSGDFAFKTRFIQQASLAMLTNQDQWSENDAAYILLTDKAREYNWQIPTNIRNNSQTNADEEYVGLKDQLGAMALPMPVTPVDLKDGNNEEEMWDIFDTIYNLLQDGDELYFDITHGFRYLPMYVVVLGNYAKFLKNVTVKGITYGNYEASHDGNAPIMDLLPLSTLQNWTYAAADFLRHGDANRLKECATAELKPILKETRGQDAAASNLRGLCTALNNFSEELSFCRGMDILAGTSATNVESLVDNAGKSYLRPFVPLFDHIKTVTAPFQSNAPANMIRASRLCFYFGNYQAAITLLEEGIATFFCLRYGIEANDNNLREAFGRAIKMKQLKLDNKELKYVKSDKEKVENIVDCMVDDELIDENLMKQIQELKDLRNDINHAGMRKNPAKCIKLHDNLANAISLMEDFMNASNDPAWSALPPLFLNLSNHPYSEWQEEQRKAAEVYGECKDMPFPQVDPDATEKQINDLVEQYVKQITPYTKTNKVTVHLMGEMCFTYRMVKRLSALGIRCVCSTSYRIVRAEGNGKYVEFQFKQFRDYDR